MPKEIDDFTFFFFAETDKAIRASETDRETDGFWLPKSQIEYEVKGRMVDVTMPVWLASAKKLAGY